MTVLRFFGISLLLTGFSVNLPAQELDVTVSIDRKQITNVNIDWLEQAIPQMGGFLNDYQWTQLEFQETERIKAQVQIIFNSIDASGGAASGQFVLTTQRPVYGTTAFTQVLTHADDQWQFNYPRNRTLLHDEQTFDAVGSLLNFYALIILGFDADTFAPLGGTPFFERALQTANIAQNGGPGWGRDGRRRNRTYMAEFLLDPQFQPLRQAQYLYHRQGLDLFVSDPLTARTNALQALRLIRETQRKTTEQYPFMLFFNTKFREIVRIFEDAEPVLKAEVHALLTELDPGHLSEYDKLR